MDTATRARLVLVEDDQATLEVFSIVLGERYVVFGYGSAVEALKAIDSAKPDVLVLDIGMRPVDGVQCLKMIRATPGYRDIPAVALTGFARDVERRSFLDRGFQAVVVKPIFDPEELIDVIERLLKSAAAVPPTPTHPRRGSALPTRSAAAAQLDAQAAMTASPAGGGPADTDGREPG